MLALARERRVRPCRFPLRPAVHDGEIFLLDMTTLHREAEASRGRGIFRDQDKAAGLAIEPVDDRNLPAVDQLEGEQLAQARPKASVCRRVWLG